MSFRTRVLFLGGLVALPLLVLAMTLAARDLRRQEAELAREQVAIAGAVAGAVATFVDGDLAAIRAMAALPVVRTYGTRGIEELEEAIRPVFEAFSDVDTVGLIGLDGWNVFSLTRGVPVPPRTVNVADRPYFVEALQRGRPAFSPAVLSRVRPGVPVVAIAVPIMPVVAGTPAAMTAQPAGVLVGTLSLSRLREHMEAVVPDDHLGVILLDVEAQALVAPHVDFAAIRELISMRGRPDVDAALAGQPGSRVTTVAGEELLVAYAPVRSVGWAVLVQQPVAMAFGPARQEVVQSVGLLTLALGLSLALALFLTSRVTRAYEEVESARAAAEQRRQRAAFLADASRQLTSTLDHERALEAVARAAVPVLADWCIVDLVDTTGSELKRVAVAYADPAKHDLACALHERAAAAPGKPDEAGENTGVRRVVRSGDPLLLEEVSHTLLEPAPHDGAHYQHLRAIAPRSMMVVPLRGQRGTLGAMSFIIAESDRRYDSADFEVACDLADRAALAVENARLFEQVQAAVRMRGEFLAAAAHDLKNPLASVKTQAQLLQRRARRGMTLTTADVLAATQQIDDVVTRAAEMVDEFLDIARYQLGGALTLQKAPVDLVLLVREAVADYSATNDRHRLRVEAPDAPLIGEWDGRRLRRALDNVVSNAIKYSPAGGEVVISIAYEAASPGEAGGAGGADEAEKADGKAERVPHAVLTVRDQGIGIPKEDLPVLFEWFRRGSNVAGHIAGTGIGLTSARYIVESHGGAIAVESEQGQGTSVTICLPLTPLEPSAAPAPSAPAAA